MAQALMTPSQEMPVDVESYGPSPLDKDQQNILANWVAVVLKDNTRFDQRKPTAEYPAPELLSPTKALLIVSFVEQSIINNPSVADQFKPDADGTYRRPKPGEPWHEWECACLVEEVAELQRAGGYDSKATGTNMFRYLSGRLNRRYGIDRSENSVKNTWYRELRARSGIDERAAFRSPGKNTARLSTSMRVSLTGSPRKSGGRSGGRGSGARSDSRSAVRKASSKASPPKWTLKLAGGSLSMIEKQVEEQVEEQVERQVETPVEKEVEEQAEEQVATDDSL
jgi:hypothetical protein